MGQLTGPMSMGVAVEISSNGYEKSVKSLLSKKIQTHMQ